MKFIFSFFALCISMIALASNVIISGIANDYVGKKVKIFEFEDYLSRVKHQLANTIVQDDSTFILQFENHETKKIRVEIGENNFQLYIQPHATYRLSVEKNSPYLDRNAKGIEVEFFFLDLDTNDINYKILQFEDRQLDFLKKNYNFKSMNSKQFVTQLDSFKRQSEEHYKNDTNFFFKTYVKYSIASLDDLSFMGNRNKYEKYDFYLKHETVYYQNDRFMDYLTHFYERYDAELNTSVSEEFYKGILKSSPTLMMKALGGDYCLKNIRVRELIMIKMLSESFYSKKYPQTNIITILDSLKNHSLFKEHREIAKNIRFRLLDLQPGTLMPDFNLTVDGKNKSKEDYSGVYVYMQFVHLDNQRSLDDIKLMKPLYQKYAKYCDFITILVVNKDRLSDDFSTFIKENEISWDFSVIKEEDATIERLGVSNFPEYLLMDAAGYVVAAPALSPRPNNEYETIERSLFAIARYYRQLEEKK